MDKYMVKKFKKNLKKYHIEFNNKKCHFYRTKLLQI